MKSSKAKGKVFLGENQFIGVEKLTPVAAILSSTRPGWPASECIDRAVMCSSKYELTPWLALDYGKGKKVSVEKVVLSTLRWSSARNVTIRLSNELPTSGSTMFSGGEALATFKGPATSGQIEIHSEPGWDKKTGRYLIIQINNGKLPNYLNLKEAYAVGISKGNR